MLRATRTFAARCGFVAVRLQCMEARARRGARALRHSPSAAGARPAASFKCASTWPQAKCSTGALGKKIWFY